MIRQLILAAPLVLLAGCAGSAGPCPPSAAAPFAPAADECRAGELSRYVGVLPGTEVMAAITATAGERALRIIRPGDAVTMDYSPSRLNVELGEDGRIKRLRCG